METKTGCSPRFHVPFDDESPWVFLTTDSSHIHILFDSRVRMRRICGTVELLVFAMFSQCTVPIWEQMMDWCSLRVLIRKTGPSVNSRSVKYLVLCSLLYPGSGGGNEQAPHKGTSRSRGAIQEIQMARTCEVPLKLMQEQGLSQWGA